ncbi:hypothetical protein MKZ38_005559 [Zalerion maritima]|uniref:GOLD domain-containing protein n=1 Tax=Zalerion maritima TaxID=339359 RepID=A0AAD5RKX1_9PEZI|nr:hypothetical protein MKZ38_005559 [Zalerion maritima]
MVWWSVHSHSLTRQRRFEIPTWPTLVQFAQQVHQLFKLLLHRDGTGWQKCSYYLVRDIQQYSTITASTNLPAPPNYTGRMMKLSFISMALVATQAAATALTYKLTANEKACFYAGAETKGQKVAFYFAVQSGGSFDVDYEVVGPNEKVILDGAKERQGDFVFTANEVGEYRFCFDNEMSTYTDKFVDFEIAVENEARAKLPSKQGSSPEQTTALEESIFKVSGQLSTITRNQKYFRTRENRNFSTVRSTEKRIINFSLIQCALIVAMGALQVFIVRFFFQGARKGYV